MKLLVKTLSCFTILLLFLNPAYSQLRLNAGGNSDLVADLKRVIEDHPNHFKNITGDLIVQNPQSSDYRCSLKINGAEECFITKYASEDKEICSWQALLLTTENFNDAKKKFRSLYNQLNNLAVNSSRLTGVYESPEEERKFTNVIFSFASPDESNRKLKVEIVMESEMMDWNVKVLVYEREREDDEPTTPGKIIE